ncbi:hypothetical protein L1049_017634 [Liquidambar formosana]|uniref:Uncharacterized protein n=1 Tax=Liquidambar formosana TaxID=63359 RepID=A0AAP0S819_LIQFO
MCHDNTNLDSDEQCKDSEEGTQMVSENGEVPTELTVTDCNPEAEEPIEEQIIEEIEEKKEDAYALGNEDSGREVTEQCVPQSLPIEQAQGVFSPSPVSSVHPLDHEQDSVMESKTVEDSDILIADSKQESCSEFFVTKSSETDSTKSTVETAVSAVESENEKPQQDPSQYIEKTPTAVAETEVSANQSNELCAKDETSAFASVGRLSTESNPENQNIPVQFRKCPSFNFDLLIETRTEESDQTPLLYQDRTAAGSVSSRVGARTRSPVAETEYNLDPLQNQAMAVQEKGKLERSDSERSRTPFLSLMKEQEEAHLVVTPQKNDSLGDGKKSPEELWNSSSTKEVASTSPKRKEKRKPRSSLFSNCMCCAAMIN